MGSFNGLSGDCGDGSGGGSGGGGGGNDAWVAGTGSGNAMNAMMEWGSGLGPEQGQSCQSLWPPPDDMGSFSLLDLDPLATLFPPNTYNECCDCRTEVGVGVGVGLVECKQQPSDMADVLLSLKHAVVHPGQLSPPPPCQAPHYAPPPANAPQASLSYTVHPHQMAVSMSPSGGGGCYTPSSGAPQYGCAAEQMPMQFPSMSVNVSMNMTMHGYPPCPVSSVGLHEQMPQVQWTPAPNPSPVYQSPQYAGATYSFTADFRPPPAPPPEPAFATCFKPPQHQPKQQPHHLQQQQQHHHPHQQQLHQQHQTQQQTKRTKLTPEPDAARPNQCRICGKTYARPSTLKTHLRTHSGEKPYRCDDCNKSFSQAANLTAHVRTHSGEKPFRCPICARRFSQSSSVTTHMRTHSGERPYRCRLCKKAFSDSSTLTKHLRIHSGEKPYQCKLCLLRFSQSGNLNRHMRVHGSPSLPLGLLPA